MRLRERMNSNVQVVRPGWSHSTWVTYIHVTSRRRKLLTVWWCTRPGSQGDQKLPAPTSLKLAGDNDVTTHDGRAGVDSLPKKLGVQEEVGRVGYDKALATPRRPWVLSTGC
ncbi:unnamed protein product [Phytophthora lilii]|uniref:Unnamed protein product n=1 Tax=Phytophthora lilii TaxID=2077276 RepID=A0A9W6WY59_9STRA|nr:unnamed protein product [Phytophthora lilii]